MQRKTFITSIGATISIFALGKFYVEYSKSRALEIFADSYLHLREVGKKTIMVRGADFKDERHSKLKIMNAVFISCKFTESIFLENEWHNVIFEDCDFVDTMIGDNAVLEVTVKRSRFIGTQMDRCYIAGKKGYITIEDCNCKGQKADAINDAFVEFGCEGPTRVHRGTYYKTGFDSDTEVLIEDAHLESVGASTNGDSGSKVSLIRCKGDQVGTGSVEECKWQDCDFKYSSLNGDIKKCVFERVNTCLDAWEAEMGSFNISHCNFITTGKTQYGPISYSAIFTKKMQRLTIEDSIFHQGKLRLLGVEEDLDASPITKMQRANVKSISLSRSSFDTIDIDLLNSQSVLMNDVRTNNLSITNGLIASWSINNLHIDKTVDTTGTQVENMQAQGVTKGHDFKSINAKSNVVL